jgi:hypothetical protein
MGGADQMGELNIQYSKCTTENLRVYFKEHAVPEEKLVEEELDLHAFKNCKTMVKIIWLCGFCRDFICIVTLGPGNLQPFLAVGVLLFMYLAVLFLCSLVMKYILRPMAVPYTVEQENLANYEKRAFKKYGKFLDFQDVLKIKQIDCLDINEYFLLVEYKENDLIINSVKITLTENLKKCGFVTENGLDFTWLDEKIQKDLCAWGLGSMHF